MKKLLQKTILKNLRFVPAFIAILLCLVSGKSWGQKSITSLGTAVTENFDGMGNSATATLPTGFKIGIDWSSGTTVTTLVYGTSGTGAVTGSSGGGAINWASGVTASSTDRALGFLSSSSYTSPRSIVYAFTNNTGSTVTSIDISFDYEKYRTGTRAFDWTFFHGSTSAPSNSATSGDQAYAGEGANAVVNPPTTIAKSFTISGLSIANGSTYYLRWTYTGNGGSTNAQGLGVDNFSITANGGTPAGTSTIAAGPGPIPSTISSLTNTSGAASMNFDFTITDDGATNDANPTLINQIVINKGSNNWPSNWTQAIAGAELSDGTNTASGTINASNITFASLPNSSGSIGYIADDGTKTYSLKIWLNSSLGGSLPAFIDGKQFEFLIQTSGITTENTGSSVIATGQSVASGAATNVVTVVATKLDFVQNTTTPTGINAAMTPAPTVSADDANGNRDLDFVSAIDITSTGTLTGSPVSETAVAGLSTFATLTHTVAGTGLQLTAASTGLTNSTSNLFDITIASSATDFFRSKVSGDWGSAGTWQSSSDNSIWNDATLAPDASASTITIRNGHTVTVAAAAGGDEVVVESGATLTLNANFALADGTGDDLVVNGLVINTAGTITISSGATAHFNAGSTYRHNRNGSDIITATWDPASTVEITGITGTQPINSSLIQTFGNFTWNCSGQTGNIGLGTPTGMSIAGDLTVTSTGGVSNRAFRFTSNSAFSISIGGKLILNGGHLGLSSGSGATTMTVAGNVEVSNSSELYLAQGGSANNTLNIGGDLSITNGTITETGSGTNNQLVFNKTGTQNYNAVTATLSNDLNYSVSSASTLVLNNDLLVNTNGTLTIDGIVNAGTSQITGAGDVVINGSLISSHPNGVGATGTLANTGTNTFNAASIVKFNAVGAQTFTARTDYANVIIDGGGDKTLDGNAVLSGNLTLTNGKVIVGTNNITVGGIVSGGSSSNYLVTNGTGHLTLNNITSTPKTFPVGDGAYNPVIINNGSGHDWSVNAKDGLPVANTGFNNTKAVALTWEVTPSVNPPAAGADISFQFDEATQVGGSFATTTNVQAWHDVTGSWIGSGAPVALNLSVPNAAKAAFSGLTKFSRYAISNIDGPLPVFFANVKATQVAAGVQVDWSNLTETDMSNYVIERSANGSSFATIGIEYNVRNYGARADYSYTDRTPNSGVNFYRIKGVEQNGGSKYSVIVKVDLRSSGTTDLVLYPVPATGGVINYQAVNLPKGNYHLNVYDASGRQVLNKTFAHSGGTISESLNLPAASKGMYTLMLRNENSNANNKMIKTFIMQ